MAESKYDVIVIGSGPAGACAAAPLAQAGLRTLILEKENLPRYKPCGGGLTTKVPGIVDFDLGSMAEATISRLYTAWDHRAMVDLQFPQPIAWCIMRDKFDQFLTERAAKAGAVLHTGEPVQALALDDGAPRVKTAQGEYRAEVVVGADGVNSLTARAAGLNEGRTLAGALEVEMEVPAAQRDAWRNTFYFDFGAVSCGYAWIFPKEDHLSVGIGSFASGKLLKRRKKGNAPDLRARLARWVDGEPTLRGHRDLLTRGHLLSLGGREAPLQRGRVVLTGDAASLVDPFTGEGIYYAMRSGQIAANVIQEAFRREDLSLAEYTPRVYGEFMRDFTSSLRITRLFYRFPWLCLKVVSLFPEFQGAVTGAVDNSRGYAGFMWKAVRKVGDWLEAIG